MSDSTRRDSPACLVHRRHVLRLLGGFGLLLPLRTLARAGGRTVPPPAPAAGDFRLALATALQGHGWTASDQVLLEVPLLAENGAIVPLTVESRLPDTRRLLVFAERNPGPLLAEFQLEAGADPWLSLRVKLNDSGPLLAIAESGGRYYGTQVEVKVMVGGCG